MRGFRVLVGLLIPVALAAAGYLWLRRPPTRPNVLVVTVDTLRADHLGLYGHERDTSPTLDAWARDAVVFDAAFTNATLSGPSHATMMTSLHVPLHGVSNNTVELDEDRLTVAEVFRSAGYDTALFASHPFIGGYGLDQGFDVAQTHTVHSHGPGHAHGDEVQVREPLEAVFDAALDWIARPRERPFFLWLHVQHVHASHEPPPPYDTRFVAGPPESEHDLKCLYTTNDHEDGKIRLSRVEQDYIVAQYDGEIAYVDAQLARVLRAVESLETITVLTADHGEMLFSDPERRLVGHGRQRFDPVLRVPWIVAGAAVAADARRIEALVGLIDLAPTLVELAGLRVPSRFEGRSLVPLIRGRVDSVREHNFSVTFHSDNVMRLSARSPEVKLICDRTASTMDCAAYDLTSDPDERRDLTPSPGPAGEALLAELEHWFMATMARSVTQALEPRGAEALELLRRAGYLRPDEE